MKRDKDGKVYVCVGGKGIIHIPFREYLELASPDPTRYCIMEYERGTYYCPLRGCRQKLTRYRRAMDRFWMWLDELARR